MDKDCFVNIKGELLEGEFIGAFQRSQIIEPSLMVGGHKGGVVAYPITVVKLDGKFKEVKLSDVTFQI